MRTLIIVLLFICVQIKAQDETLFCIFYTEKAAIDFSVKVHNYLTENRPGYNATHWSDVNKADKEEKWLVKLPYDFQKWPVKLSIDITVKEQIPIKDVRVFLKSWEPITEPIIKEPIIIKR